MAVYVDDFAAPLGRMIMCHMLADSSDELHLMAERIGVARRHFQGDHYDICRDRRTWAVKSGAVEISRRDAVAVRRRFRKTL